MFNKSLSLRVTRVVERKVASLSLKKKKNHFSLFSHTDATLHFGLLQIEKHKATHRLEGSSRETQWPTRRTRISATTSPSRISIRTAILRTGVAVTLRKMAKSRRKTGIYHPRDIYVHIVVPSWKSPLGIIIFFCFYIQRERKTMLRFFYLFFNSNC